MPKKELTYDTDAREAILAGVEKLAQAVVSTLGPRGRCAILDKSWGGPLITKDGVTVARDIELSDKAENLGAQIVKQAATKTNDRAGDGTTTATLLAWSIYREALRHLSSGADTQGLITGMRKASAAVTEGLKNKSKKVGGIDGIRAVATIAANGDEKVGKMLADAFAKVGEDGVITVEEGKSLETEVSIVTGMQFDRGLLSPNFATDLETLEAVLDQPLILIHEDKISNVQTLLPLLEASKESNRPLLIIAEDIEGEALAALVVNKLRGILNVCAVKAPGYGDRRKEILQDLAAVTGATPIMKDGLHDLEKATLEMLGSARRVVIDSANTTIVEGTGEQSEIDNSANHTRKQVENTTSDYDREKLEERLARLVGGIGQISVGGATEAEVKERKARIEDSKAATMAALEEGILPGGGTALLKIASKINLDLPEAQAAGANILLRALREPVRVIAENAGMDGSVIARRVLKTRKFAEGYNALDDTYGDLIEMGVVDPTKVTRTALENAVSVAATLMTTDCLVVDAKSDQDDVPAGMESGMGL